VHTPPLQADPALQAFPQAPQFVVVSSAVVCREPTVMVVDAVTVTPWAMTAKWPFCWYDRSYVPAGT
jgi:hypothetical protein